MNDARPLPPVHPRTGERYRVVFMGTPDFAVPSLERLIAAETVVGVFTQPDRPAGRGSRVQLSPVKRLALAEGIPVFQPASLRRDPEPIATLRGLEPDIVVVAAYGLILPPAILTAAPGAAINVHASLLPRWRGAAPINHAILAGDAETGATIMLIEEGLDTGPILSQRVFPLVPDAAAGAVTAELAHMGAVLLIDTLRPWLRGEITPHPQDPSAATYAPRLAREDGALDWHLPAELLERRVRAFDPWPGTTTHWFAVGGDVLLKVLAATVVVGSAEPQPPPGTVVATPEGPAVVAGAGLLRLDRVQPAGKRPMTGAEFARGRPELIGAQLGSAAGVPA